jgi:hypothetical protein
MLTQCVNQHQTRGWASHTVHAWLGVCMCVGGEDNDLLCVPIPKNWAEGRTPPYSVHMFVPDLDSSVTNSIDGPSVTRTA